jgi:diguanylate cyclase
VIVAGSVGAHRLRRVVGGVFAAAAGAVVTAVVVASGMPAPAWDQVGVVAAAAVVGFHLQFSVRLGNQRLLLLWCNTAVAIGLVLLPAPWVVLTTAAGIGVATFGPGGLRPLKAGYNTALYTAAAAVAAVCYRSVDPGPLVLSSWTGPVAVLVAMLAFTAVVDAGVPGVIAAASGRRFVATWLDGAGARCVQAGADLVLSVGSALAVAAQPRFVVMAPLVGVLLHFGYRGMAAAQLEWRFAQRLVEALREVGAGQLERGAVARRAVEQVGRLLAADTVELVLHGRQPLLARYTMSGQVWTGLPGEAGAVVGEAVEVKAVGPAGRSLGELRVYTSGPLRLAARERAALDALAAAVATALQNAATHAEMVEMAALAEHAANHDAVTGLPGRQRLLGWIAADLAAHRDGGDDDAVGLICINIKGFAEILGEFPAEAADQLLVHAAGRLAVGVESAERLAHVGGDTFAVWCPSAEDVEYVRERAEFLLTALASVASVYPGPIVLSGVAGVVYAPPSTISSAEQLLRQARAALREGHRLRLPVTVYRAEDDTHGQSAIVLASELRTALRKQQLELEYRPVLELATGNPVAVQATPQWLHPALGLLPPEEWMPVLEQTDLVGRYLVWLLEEALDAHCTWCQLGVPVPVAVQVPAPALLDPAMPGAVITALSRAGVAPPQLTLELTGTWVFGEAGVVDRVLEELVGHGVQLAVDTAELSLEELCRVPASEIKLPRCTTDLLLVDQESRARVKGVVAFADEMDLRVTAHDIPTLEHVAALIGLRVHAGQGPCLSRPQHASEIVGALQLASVLTLSARNAKVITFPPREH